MESLSYNTLGKITTMAEFTSSGRPGGAYKYSAETRRFGFLNEAIDILNVLIKQIDNNDCQYKAANSALIALLEETQERYVQERLDINQKRCTHNFSAGKCSQCGAIEKIFEEEEIRCSICGRFLTTFVSKDGKDTIKICRGKH